MLEIKDLEVYIGKTYVLKTIDLTVNEGEVVALIGANGAGKTTTLSTISGLYRPSGGTITFTPIAGKEPIDLARNSAEDIVRGGISHCPEGRQILSSLNVRENLLIGAYLRQDKEEIQKDLRYVYSIFPILEERQRQSGGSLSGGEQMMLALGRALMSRPELMLLDEPSLGLAPMLVQKLFEMLKKIHEDGTTILLVEQNAAMALDFADRAYVMESGQITLNGTGAELKDNEQVQRAYLGVV
jgi:branched-chain amino acid transport system ATP-binding protein